MVRMFSFIDNDLETIYNQLEELYREFSIKFTGESVSPNQIELALISAMAYRESLLRARVNFLCQNNFFQYAQGEYLDILGGNYGVLRLQAMPAQILLKIDFTEAYKESQKFLAGLRFLTPDKQNEFQLIEDTMIYQGQKEIQLCVRSIKVGPMDMDIQGEWICLNPWDNIQGITVVSNLMQGAEVETDEHFRKRLLLSMAKYSTAGTKEGYKFHALSVHSNILDVAVESLKPGEITLFILVDSNMPYNETLEREIYHYFSKDTLRPMGDYLIVQPAQKRDIDVNLEISLEPGYRLVETLAKTKEKVEEICMRWKHSLGGYIASSQIISAIHNLPEVSYVLLAQTVDTQLLEKEYANFNIDIKVL